MTAFKEYRCEICGTVTNHPMHWWVIQCGNAQLTVLRWDASAADAADALHFCGEAHAQVYISRWFEAACSPPRPDFAKTSTAPR
jgi:hypothetical protein